MALSEFEVRRCEKLVSEYAESRRPPPHIRPQLDIGYRLQNQSVELFEIRPVWRGRPGQTMEHSIAKTTFVKTRGVWRLYWKRADLEWHAYDPVPEVQNFEEFLAVVEADAYGCFYG
jgi:hypothetical protein